MGKGRLVLAWSALLCASALASGTIGYGSRVGMEVTVISMSGLDTSNAVIRTKHTRGNAAKFCKEYADDPSEKCIDSEMSIPLNDEIHGNCVTGGFVDFFGNEYQFDGKIRHKTDLMANYALRHMSGPNRGQLADGSSASNYPTAMSIYKDLCPSEAPPEEMW